MQFTHHEYRCFYAWCADAAADLADAQKGLAKYGSDYESRAFPRDIERQIARHEDTRDKNVVLAPVLAVMAAEQLISTYAMQRLKDPLIAALGIIDRLDTESKWQAIPLMACGRGFADTSDAMRRLRMQIKQRNSFAHPKPLIVAVKDDEHMEKLHNRLDGTADNRIQVALDAPATVVLLADELLALDPHRKTRSALEAAGLRAPRARTSVAYSQTYGP